MFSRNIRTRLDLIHPVPDKINDQADISEMKTRQLKVGDLVWARSYHTEQKWIPGKITKKYGPRNYKVMIGEQMQKLPHQPVKEKTCTSREEGRRNDIK